MTIGVFAIALMVVAITVVLNAGAAVASFAARHQLPSSSAPVIAPARHHFVGELGVLSAPMIVAATFALILILDRQSLSPGFQQPISVPADSPLITQAEGGSSSANVAAPSRPAWVDQSPTRDGLSERIVLGSQQYSTREEAEQELSTEACILLQQDLAKLFPGESSVSRWKPTPETIKRYAVKQQFVEVADRDFGSFVHPMYRVWWQLELSPEVRVEFLPLWRQGITAGRIRIVGAVLSSLVLVISLVAFYYRGCLLMQGAGRVWLGCVTALAIFAWFGVIMAFRSS